MRAQNFSTGSSSSVGSTSDGTSDGTDGGSDDVGGLTVSLITGAAVLAGVILLVVYLSKRRIGDEQDGQVGDEQDGQDQSDFAPVRLTRSLLDSGLLATRGELGVQVALLAQGPAAFDQLSDELARGVGPAVDELVRTTGLSADVLRPHWEAARGAHGDVIDSATATRVVADFVSRLAPNIHVSDRLISDLVWRLALEYFGHKRTDPVPTHDWVAGWLGVPVEAVLAASEEVFWRADWGRTEAREARIRAEPELYLNRLATELDSTHRDQIDARVRELVLRMGPWLPPHLVSEVPHGEE